MVLLADLEKATHPRDIFGDLPDDRKTSLKDLYRTLSKQFHPDLNNNDPEYITAFAKLSALYESALDMLDSNTYDALLTISTPNRTYSLVKKLFSGSFFDVYLSGSNTAGIPVFIPHEPKFNPLMQAWFANLTKLLDNSGESYKHIWQYTGTPRECFTIDQNGYHYFCFSLVPPVATVLDYMQISTALENNPTGYNPKDMVWIYKRALDFLGFSLHSTSFVHNALTPNNILIGLGDVHHVWIINFAFSYFLNDTKPSDFYIESQYKSFYPPELIKDKEANDTSDLYLLAKTMYAFVDPSQMPREIQAFFTSFDGPVTTRPFDPFTIRKEFSFLVDKLWKREYRPFSLNKGNI